MQREEIGRVALPHANSPGYDHADVHSPTGRVFVANTELDQLEVLDGPSLTHLATIPDCEGASGVLVAEDRVLGAARGSGELLMIDASALEVVRRFPVGPSPNGLSWDALRRQVLVADVLNSTARVFDLDGRQVAERQLGGRPRWVLYDSTRDAFLVNIREPAAVELLRADDLALIASIAVDAQGPHGLGLDFATDTALVACDDASLLWIDLGDGKVRHSNPLAGGPDVLWVDTRRRAAYVAVGDPGTLHVFDLDTRTELGLVETGAGAHTTALDEERGRLYVFVPAFRETLAYSLSR